MAGGCVTVINASGSIHKPTAAGWCYTLTFPDAATNFTATIDTTTGVDHVSLFAEHVPTEFGRDERYFLSADLTVDVKPDEETDLEEYNCRFHKDAQQVHDSNPNRDPTPTHSHNPETLFPTLTTTQTATLPALSCDPLTPVTLLAPSLCHPASHPLTSSDPHPLTVTQPHRLTPSHPPSPSRVLTTGQGLRAGLLHPPGRSRLLPPRHPHAPRGGALP